MVSFDYPLPGGHILSSLAAGASPRVHCPACPECDHAGMRATIAERVLAGAYRFCILEGRITGRRVAGAAATLCVL